MRWALRADISWGIAGDPNLDAKNEKPPSTSDLGTLVFSILLKFATMRAHSAADRPQEEASLPLRDISVAA